MIEDRPCAQLSSSPTVVVVLVVHSAAAACYDLKMEFLILNNNNLLPFASNWTSLITIAVRSPPSAHVVVYTAIEMKLEFRY